MTDIVPFEVYSSARVVCEGETTRRRDGSDVSSPTEPPISREKSGGVARNPARTPAE